MHTGKNNPNYTHNMTGFSLVVIKQETLRLRVSQYLQCSTQCSAAGKKARTFKSKTSYHYSTTKMYYVILASPSKKG